MEKNIINQPPNPGPAHKRLEVFIGRWNTEGLTKEGQFGPATKIIGVDTYEWLEGGFFLVHRVDVQMGDDEVKGIEIIGYDDAKQTYHTYSFDNQGNNAIYEARVLNGIWNFAGESERATVEFSEGGNSITGKWERLGDDSNWHPWMDVKLKRTK